MRVVYFTSGITASGHIVRGIAVGLGLRRSGLACDFTILHPASPFGELCSRMGLAHEAFEPEDESALLGKDHASSALYRAFMRLSPDVLVVDLHWAPLHAFIRELRCRKIFMCRQVHPRFFAFDLSTGPISFRPDDWDEIFAIEPWETPFPMRRIDPIVMRNPDEIPSREVAREKLGLPQTGNAFMLALNAHDGDFDAARKTYSYLEDEGWSSVYTTNYRDGLFPAVDWFNAVDLVVCGAGYNSFWESVFFGKETLYLPQNAVYEDAWLRLDGCLDYEFKENGADTLARIIVDF
ncbi:MAG: hypothetical protein NT080_08960 [Spirochaetes bacterium]|nr:hypothetical protein [Spirochaetota bacterium]